LAKYAIAYAIAYSHITNIPNWIVGYISKWFTTLPARLRSNCAAVVDLRSCF